MDKAALIVPHVFTRETHHVAGLEFVDPRRDRDVVTDEYCLAGREPQYEPLVRRALGIVAEYTRHDALASNLDIGRVLLKGALDRVSLSMTTSERQREDQYESN